MNYINKGKRDILIFPQFDNIDKIQNIRNKYDELSQILPPHITLVFPFEIDLKNDDLEASLEEPEEEPYEEEEDEFEGDSLDDLEFPGDIDTLDEGDIGE